MKQSVTVGAQLLWGGRYGCNNGRYGCTIVMSYIEINKAVSQWLLTFNLCVSVTWPLTCAFHIPCTHTPEIIDMHRGVCDNIMNTSEFASVHHFTILTTRRRGRHTSDRSIETRGFPLMFIAESDNKTGIWGISHKWQRRATAGLEYIETLSHCSRKMAEFMISKMSSILTRAKCVKTPQTVYRCVATTVKVGLRTMTCGPIPIPNRYRLVVFYKWQFLLF